MRSDERGAFAVIFALSLVPMTFLVGAAVDYSGATNLLAHLQKATDGTGLKLCQMDSKASKTELEDVAKQMMTSYFGAVPFTIEKLTPTSNPRTVEIETKATYPTAVLRAFGPTYSQVPVVANARCTGEPQTFEIALVLDTTGSMSRSSGGKSKMDAMKVAATDFVNYIFDHPIMSKNAKMSLVPFAPSVAVNPSTFRSASWLDQDGKASHHWLGVQGGKTAANAAGATNRFTAFDQLKTAFANWDWTGCLESAGYPFNVKDEQPTSSNADSYYVPMWAPDESGDGGQVVHGSVATANSYINDSNSLGYCQPVTDETARTGRPCKYLQLSNAKNVSYHDGKAVAAVGPNFSCASRPLTRLGTSKTTLVNEIAALQPAGNTNIHEGFVWGWRTISNKSVFGNDAAPYGKQFNNKIVVLMTDGMNTWGHNPQNPTLNSYYSAYGFFKNPDGSKPNGRLPPAHANPDSEAKARAAMDALTLEACANARAEPNNVTIYTVGFSVPNDPIDQQGLDLLKTCAGSPSRAFVATSSNEILEAFQQIAQSIGNLRLTR